LCLRLDSSDDRQTIRLAACLGVNRTVYRSDGSPIYEVDSYETHLVLNEDDVGMIKVNLVYSRFGDFRGMMGICTAQESATVTCD
jgi:hypothetical protein